MSHLPSDIQERLDKNKASGLFTGKYVVFSDKGEIRQVSCMRCGVKVKGFMPMRDSSGEFVSVEDHTGQKFVMVELKAFPNYRQIELIVEKTVAHEKDEPIKKPFHCNPIVCDICAKSISDKDKEDLWACVMAGWEQEMISCKRSDDDIKSYIHQFVDCQPGRTQ